MSLFKDVLIIVIATIALTNATYFLVNRPHWPLLLSFIPIFVLYKYIDYFRDDKK